MSALADALNIVMHRRLCHHEAAHAAAALLGGLHVTEVSAGVHDLSVEPTDLDAPAGFVDIVRDRARAREHAVAILAGPLCDDDPHWPPRWPLSLAPTTSDERQLGELVKGIGLDRAGYSALVDDAYQLVTSRRFDRLHMAVCELLEHGSTLDAHTFQQVDEIAREPRWNT